MDASLLMGGGLIAGLLAGFWGTVKAQLFKIFSLLFVTIKLENDDGMIRSANIWLWSECWCVRLGVQSYSSTYEYVQPLEKTQMIGLRKTPRENTLWFFGRKPFWVRNDGTMTITFIRGTFNADDFVINFIENHNNLWCSKLANSGNHFFIRRLVGSIGKKNDRDNGSDCLEKANSAPSAIISNGISDKESAMPLKWNRKELGFPVNCGSLSLLSLQENVLEAYKEILTWKKSEKWFKSRKIPWKRGVLLTGAPGTGKTAFARALGQELDMPIFIFDLATMNNGDFINGWEEAVSRSPSIALFEDIDGVFDGRKNVSCTSTMEQGLSFDCFLNVIDGVASTDGVLKIVTTNDMSKIDPALGTNVNGSGMSTRPGRIDKIVEFLPLDDAGKLKMAQRIFNGFPESDWSHILKEGEHDTGAQYQDRCCSLAIRLFWEKDDDFRDKIFKDVHLDKSILAVDSSPKL